MSAIVLHDVSFGYDKNLVLENINLEVRDGDFLAIIGPNGGGKSTLLKLMLGILDPDRGNVSIYDGTPSSNIGLIGYVPQNTNVNIDFPITVLEVVMMGDVSSKRALFGYSVAQKESARSALKAVGMLEYANRRIGKLSGGQRQRVMIARALCASPEILLLDEPTANIDAQGQKEIYALLKKLNQEMSIVVVSHDISVILEYANKAAYINKKLEYHDISDKKNVFHTHGDDDHICEVELLQMLSSKECKKCEDEVML